MADTLKRLNEIFCEVFNDEDVVISRQTTAKDISDWDSIMHVSLIVNIEKVFAIRFSSSEIANLQTVGELVDLIDSKGHA
jgi:acyl carrier protein